MTTPKVLVTRRWPEAVEKKLSELFDVTFNENDAPMSEEEIRDAMMEYDAILPTVTDKVGAKVFEVENPRVRILGNYGVGYSHIDTDAAKEKGIVVTNTPGVLSECTADVAMTLMLMAARRAGEGEREVRAGKWTGWRPTHMIGQKVTGKTLGIIGFGRIGQEMAQRGHFGFDMPILVQNRSKIADDVLKKYNATQVDSIEDLLEKSDFVSLHCPGGEENRHLINAERLSKMKPNAVLINTARGEVVDDVALANALKSKQIFAAGLDVFDGEPKINPALNDIENLVMLPHLGSATQGTREAMGFCVVENVQSYFGGSDPKDRVV